MNKEEIYNDLKGYKHRDIIYSKNNHKIYMVSEIVDNSMGLNVISYFEDEEGKVINLLTPEDLY